MKNGSQESLDSQDSRYERTWGRPFGGGGGTHGMSTDALTQQRRVAWTGSTARKGMTSHRESQRPQSPVESPGLSLCPLWQTPWPAWHSPPGALVGPPLTVIPTGGLGLRCRVACPRLRGHVLKMRRSVRQPMATQVWPCHPTTAPHRRHPDRRAEGPQWRDPFG